MKIVIVLHLENYATSKLMQIDTFWFRAGVISKWGMHLIYIFCFLLMGSRANSQTLTLRDAVQTALNNYGTIKAKGSYLKASQASAKEASSEYLPNLSLGAQQAYGTANGEFGPAITIGGTAASSGPPFLTQNWNSAFGALYLANVNWDFFTFGRVRENVRVAKAQVLQDTRTWNRKNFNTRCGLQALI